jgi:hypothetical protein
MAPQSLCFGPALSTWALQQIGSYQGGQRLWRQTVRKGGVTPSRVRQFAGKEWR